MKSAARLPIGKIIKYRRLELGLSLRAFGKLCGLSKVSMCRIENGTRSPHLRALARMADSCNMTLHYFLFGTPVITLPREHADVTADELYFLASVQRYTQRLSNSDQELFASYTRWLARLGKQDAA
jgi:transcriptional regulator with XRE-family HTH domain